MSARLADHLWKSKYSSDAGSLVTQFYQPALACALRYDRTSGYFTAGSLTLAARGVEHLSRNQGTMRLIVGCTLDRAEVEAIERGLALREAIERKAAVAALQPADTDQEGALELLAWMIAKGILDVKVAVPCGSDRKLVATDSIFHEKAGIIEDAAGDRIAFNGSINETARAWSAAGPGNWESFHVFTSFGGTSQHVVEEEQSFARLWNDKALHLRVVDVPIAIKNDLLRFLPKDGSLPRRLAVLGAATAEADPAEVALLPPEKAETGSAVTPAVDSDDLRRRIWAVIRESPSWPEGGKWVGEATSAVVPWPHQIRAFERMYDHWPPKLLVPPVRSLALVELLWRN